MTSNSKSPKRFAGASEEFPSFLCELRTPFSCHFLGLRPLIHYVKCGFLRFLELSNTALWNNCNACKMIPVHRRARLETKPVLFRFFQEFRRTSTRPSVQRSCEAGSADPRSVDSTNLLQTLHIQRSTVCSQARNAHHALGSRASRAQKLQRHLCAPEKSLSSGPHMSHPLLLSHLPRTTSTSSSSFTLPSTTTPEHALQSGQHDLLQEHPVHHQPLQERLVEKHRYQEPLWRENQQSGGNLRNTSSTGYEPKELATKGLATKELATKKLATVARISRITDPYQLYDAQKEFGEEDHRVPITEEVMEFGESGNPEFFF